MNCTPDIFPPQRDVWPRVIVLIIVLGWVLIGVRAGYPAPDVITMVAAPAWLPPVSPRPCSRSPGGRPWKRPDHGWGE